MRSSRGQGRDRGRADRRLELLDRVVGEPLAARARDAEDRCRRRPAPLRRREHRGGSEVARDRSGLGPRGRQHRVVDVGRRDQRARGRSAGRERPGKRVVRLDTIARSERAARTVGRQRRLRDDDRAERRRAERGRRADPYEPAGAERDQLGDDGRGARPAEAGALDRQRGVVERHPRVAPESAVVVEHARAVDQLRRQPQRPPRIAREQHALGDRLVRLQDHRRMRHAPDSS
jgi:hypothetical protein